MDDFVRGLAALSNFPITPTVSVGLALWLIGGAVAVQFNARHWWRRRMVLERSVARGDPPRLVTLARQRHEAEMVALCVQVGFFLLGIAVATAPPRIVAEQPPPPWQLAAVGPVLIAAQLSLALESWRQQRYDVAVRRKPPVPARSQPVDPPEVPHA